MSVSTKLSPATDQGAQAQPSQSSKILDIQVLRGISILAVLACHLSITPTVLSLLPVKVTLPLYLGVEIFFVVSGFVIVRSLINDGFSTPRFLVKRAFRLTPAVLVFLAISAALNLLLRNMNLPDWPRGFFSTNWDDFYRQASGVTYGYFLLLDGPKTYMNGAMWSLSVEDQFYAVLALVCAGTVFAFGRRPGLVLAILFVGAISTYLAILSLRFAVLARLDIVATTPWWFRYLVHWRFDFLALGVAIGLALPLIQRRIVTTFQHAGNFLSPWLLILPFTVAAFCESPEAKRQPLLYGIGYPFAGVAFGLLVSLAATGRAFPFRDGLVYQTMVYLGNRSYSLYLLHFPVFVITWLVTYWCFPMVFTNALAYGTSQLVLTVLILLPLTEFVFRWVELPLTRFGPDLAMRMKERSVSADESRTKARVRSNVVPAMVPARGAT